jgi:manganese transport protein
MATEYSPELAIAQPSLPEVHDTVRISRSPFFWRRLLGFLGPGFLISVGYI